MNGIEKIKFGYDIQFENMKEMIENHGKGKTYQEAIDKCGKDFMFSFWVMSGSCLAWCFHPVLTYKTWNISSERPKDDNHSC